MLLPNISEAPINLTVVILHDLWYNYYSDTVSNTAGSGSTKNASPKKKKKKKKQKTSEKSVIIHEHPEQHTLASPELLELPPAEVLTGCWENFDVAFFERLTLPSLPPIKFKKRDCNNSTMKMSCTVTQMSKQGNGSSQVTKVQGR